MESLPQILSEIVPIILALVVLLVIYLSYRLRLKNQDGEVKGIGWQFIRFIVIGIALPITGILALKGVLNSEAAAAIIAGALGYTFGNYGMKRGTRQKNKTKTNPQPKQS